MEPLDERVQRGLGSRITTVQDGVKRVQGSVIPTRVSGFQERMDQRILLRDVAMQLFMDLSVQCMESTTMRSVKSCMQIAFFLRNFAVRNGMDCVKKPVEEGMEHLCVPVGASVVCRSPKMEGIVARRRFMEEPMGSCLRREEVDKVRYLARVKDIMWAMEGPMCRVSLSVEGTVVRILFRVEGHMRRVKVCVELVVLRGLAREEIGKRLG